MAAAHVSESNDLVGIRMGAYFPSCIGSSVMLVVCCDNSLRPVNTARTSLSVYIDPGKTGIMTAFSDDSLDDISADIPVAVSNGTSDSVRAIGMGIDIAAADESAGALATTLI